jgi:hypothetical protein
MDYDDVFGLKSFSNANTICVTKCLDLEQQPKQNIGCGRLTMFSINYLAKITHRERL